MVITSGDPGGVGPELVLRALADPATSGLAEFTAVGSPADFGRAAAALGLPLPRIHPVDGPGGGAPGAVPLGRPSAAGGRAAVTAVREAARRVAAGDGDALVTAPVSKEALRLAGYPWPGQTEMLADLCAASDLRVLLMAGPLRVVHVSAHRSLRDAIDAVTQASVLRTIELADGIGQRLLGRPPASPWPGSTRTPGSTASSARRTSGSSAPRWRRPGPGASTRTARCPRTPCSRGPRREGPTWPSPCTTTRATSRSSCSAATRG